MRERDKSMQLLYFFEKIRMPWLDNLMLVFTQFGGEILFMALFTD